MTELFESNKIKNGLTIDDIQIDLTVSKYNSQELNVTAKIENKSNKPVYVVVETTKKNGSAGPYLFLDKDSTVLSIASSFFAQEWGVIAEQDKSRFKLQKLEVGASYEWTITVSNLIKEIIPTYREQSDMKAIDLTVVKKIKFLVGTVPYFEEAANVITDSPLSPYLTWNTLIKRGRYKNRFLYEMQAVITTEKVLKT